MMLIALFLFVNMNHRAELRLISEFEISTLTLIGIAFFGGAASVFLLDLWKHSRKEAATTSAKRLKKSLSDQDL